MGTPPPTKAREMLTKGEVREFVLARSRPAPPGGGARRFPHPPAKKRRSPAKKAAKKAAKKPAKKAAKKSS